MKGTLFIFFLALFTMASAQNNCHSGRYYSEVFTSTTSTSGIKFGESDPFGLLSNQDLYLDIVEPVGDTLSKRPLILHQFGGGFLIGWRTEPVIPQMAEMYAKRGFVFATIDYRLGFNPLDGQSAERAVYRASQDLRASLRFLVDNADLYGIDTSAIFITGTSAGCLAAFVSTFMNESDRVDIPSTFGITFEPADLGCGNCSGNNNFNNQEVKVHGIINNWGAMLDTSYIDLAVDPADNVPVISFHGTNDIIVPYVSGQPFSLPIFPSVQGSFLIHQRLENQGVKNRLFPLQGLGHEPQLLQLQTWVTDTIIREGSKFLYEIMYGDSIEILGDATVCLNDTFTYSLPLHAGSSYCWNVTGGSIIQQNISQITVLWNALGTHLITANELDKREISKEAQLHVEVALPPLPLIDFTSNDGLFVFSSLSVANDYSWNFGDGNQGTGSLVNHQYMDTGFFLLNFWIEDDYCNKEKDTLIESTLCPNAQLDIIQDDSTFYLVNSSDFANSQSWILQDGSMASGDTIMLSFTQEGNYSFTLIAFNSICSDTITQTFPITFCSQADYAYQSNQLAVDFFDQTFNAFFHAWNFGDGNSSALPNPNHLYALPGSYTVQLITTSVVGCADTVTKQVDVDLNSSISNDNQLDLIITPNPAQDYLQITGLLEGKNYQFELFSLDGKQVIEEEIQSNTISLPSFLNGVYIIKMKDESHSFYSKILIQH